MKRNPNVTDLRKYLSPELFWRQVECKNLLAASDDPSGVEGDIDDLTIVEETW